MVMVISDNGASSEGGPPARSTRISSSTSCPIHSTRTFRPWTNWAVPSSSTTIRGAGPGQATRPSVAGSARPTRRYQRSLHRALARFHAEQRRGTERQYAHAIDMVPTVLDAWASHRPRQHKRRDPVAHRGRQPGQDLWAGDAREPPRHGILRDDGPSRHLPRRLACSVSVARPIV